MKGMQRSERTIISSARHEVPGAGFVTSELFHSFGQGPLGLAELNHARLEVVKWPFHKAGLLLVVSQEIVPQRMLGSM